jgi:hypothetical protein
MESSSGWIWTLVSSVPPSFYVLLEVDDTGFVLLDELTHLLAIVLEVLEFAFL